MTTNNRIATAAAEKFPGNDWTHEATTAAFREAFTQGALWHVAQQPSREQIAGVLDDAWGDADIDGYGDEGGGYDTAVLADAVIALLEGASDE